MATTLVVIFLMDSVSAVKQFAVFRIDGKGSQCNYWDDNAATIPIEFDIDLNKTSLNIKLLNHTSDPDPIGIKEECDLHITNSILKTVKEKFKLDLGGTNIKNIDEDFADEDFKDVGRNIENSISDTDTDFSVGNIPIQDVHKMAADSECENEYATTENNNSISSTMEFPEEAPFLVAIFETLSNITAQTCAGTLLSPHWVLTAASCVNVLSINSTNQSQYTIIAESTNPFIDGSAHNVTDVLLHPGHKHDLGGPVTGGESPKLAMLRINPGVAVVGLDVWRNKLDGDLSVRAYGWIYFKNGSSPDTIKIISIPMMLTTDNTCKLNFSGIVQPLCISTNENDSKYISLLSSGGPVLGVQGGRARVVALILADDDTPLVAVSVNRHASWIDHVLRYTDYKLYLLF